MTEEKGQAPGDVEPDERGTKQYCANFNSSGLTASLVIRVLRVYCGCKTAADERAVFANRVGHSRIRQWKAGITLPPAWAVEMLRARMSEGARLVSEMKAGPGSKAGRRNLRRGNWPR